MIRIENLNMTVGDFSLEDVSLHVRPSEYFVLLGPTGSGKTLLLETICGLARARSGRIVVDGVDMTRREPRQRRLGYLPQDYALFPEKTVRENIGYGLQPDRLWARVPAGFGRALVWPVRWAMRWADHLFPNGCWLARDKATFEELMTLVGISHLADRLPEGLSGGEKQRTALARALAIRPRVLLLDEPVSALDEQTRDEVCRQLKRIQQETGTSMVHVCHSFTEMLAVADRVGVIVDGRILQVGPPGEILQRPRNLRIAQFVQAGNLFPARARTDGGWLRLDCGQGVELLATPPKEAIADGTELTAMVRPESVRTYGRCPECLPPGTSALEGTLVELTDLGPMVRLLVQCGPALALRALLDKRRCSEQQLEVGRPVHVGIAAEDVHVLLR